ncbi:YceI family protein [Aquimarina litoralis]|uniref:YceI family protein n=1 Tax=Aquimarina litoralis TaxID=584605 RepID=UPI001C587C14|nr:YceI family protein [Aquimarina litoralis]MBW1296500.1 hypothetical protein [Aquimarina litoralis]
MKTKVRIQGYTSINKIVKIYVIALVSSSIFACSPKTDFITTDSGLRYKIIKNGNGPKVISGQEVLIHETTKYPNDSLVYTSRNRPNPLKILVGGNQVIKGVDEGLLGMQKGEIRKLIVPPALSKRTGNITFPHPDSILHYDIELIDIVDKNKVLPKSDTSVLKIDLEASTLRWEGFNKLHTGGHYGTVKFYSGEFYQKKEKVVGGEFIVNMETIANIDGGYNEGLVDHLKNEDFFDTNKYPIARLYIQNVSYKNESDAIIKADLMIKDITQPIEFDATISEVEGKIQFQTKFSIDRTIWGITHASGSIFGGVADNLLSDEVQFEVTILTE